METKPARYLSPISQRRAERRLRPRTSSVEPPRRCSRASAPVASQAAADQATIGKSLVVKGEVTGSESLYIDGKVEGAINLPGNRVTVGRNGQVAANISAREVVVLGKVRGNINASDRVDIRSEGSLTGDVIAAADLDRRRRVLQGRHRHPQAGQPAGQPEQGVGLRDPATELGCGRVEQDAGPGLSSLRSLAERSRCAGTSLCFRRVARKARDHSE